MSRSPGSSTSSPTSTDRCSLRIGVNTGEVVVGNVSGTAEYTAMGDVVNVASRLQTLAEPGGILIGDSTASLASDEILREPVDELDVRGREQPERVWRVTGRRRRVPRIGARFHDVPFVGRSTQWELLASIMAMVANGRSAIVSVTRRGRRRQDAARRRSARLVPESCRDHLLGGVCARTARPTCGRRSPRRCSVGSNSTRTRRPTCCARSAGPRGSSSTASRPTIRCSSVSSKG